MSSQPKAVTVNILDRDYQIACHPEEEEVLKASAKYLDDKMRDIRNRGNVIGIDRIAVMAALNIAHEYIQLKPLKDERASISKRIASMQKSISAVIADSGGSQQELI